MSRLIYQTTDRFKNALVNHNIPGLRWLIEGFNYYDRSRVKDVGPDRAAAEWIVRCGGKVKFDRYRDIFEDYNMLIRVTAELDPAKESGQVRLVMVDGSNSSVSGYGFRHFANITKLESVKLIGCKSMNDTGLEIMGEHMGQYLPHLHLEQCPRITEYGLKHLEKYSGLKQLVLKDLKNVHKPERNVAALQKALPNCELKFS
ncbi:unnamed protein product [Bursaphelenchus okinawaensis]|uniref:Mitochondrial ATP synthase regulatory component factor B n=1 Tax=Bursaphelenchus okinawaensis TaxID=465554 RepID=A0A811L9G8_9BILA|nr:unnamed protein product [Bursaphelenchus okinawaensis]CAG9120270.1 unnamed protein product [Bursaphelenchus okinawaensis]